MMDLAFIAPGGCFHTIRVRPDGTITNRSQHPLDTLEAVRLGSPDRIMVTAEQYERMKGMAQPRWVDGDVVDAGPADDALDRLKQRAKRTVDSRAEEARQAWVTPGSGQAFEYDLVAAEAQRLLDRGEGDAPFDDYPLLAAEYTARATAGTPRSFRDLAAAVMDRRKAFMVAIADIRQARLEAKLRIDAATDARQIEDALVGVEWLRPGTTKTGNGED